MGSAKFITPKDFCFINSSKSESDQGSAEEHNVDAEDIEIVETSRCPADLYFGRRDSLPKPLETVNTITSKKNTIGAINPTKSKPQGLKSLKSVISSFNVKAVEDLEKDYSTCNKKFAPLAITLAEIYISGKRAPINYKRAIEILCSSSLADAKYLLLKLAFSLGKYAEAYY